jgi:hypothetical protein
MNKTTYFAGTSAAEQELRKKLLEGATYLKRSYMILADLTKKKAPDLIILSTINDIKNFEEIYNGVIKDYMVSIGKSNS